MIIFSNKSILCNSSLNDWTTFAYVSINILEPLWKGGLGETMSERKHWKAEEKLALSTRSGIRVMLLRHAGYTEQIPPCSIAGRNHTRPSAWKASDPVRINRSRSPKTEEGE